MPEFKTQNQYGATFPLCAYSEAFIAFASTSGGAALDIGACYGAATIPVLEKGGRIVANDIEPSHLDILVRDTPPALRRNLETHLGAFPADFDVFPPQSFRAILVSHILHFLDIPDLYRGLFRLHELLHETGKLFALCFSPFTHRTRDFIPVYQQRKALGDPFPGFIRDCNRLGLNQAGLPPIKPLIHYMDLETLTRIFAETGFQIQKAGYVPVPDDRRIKPLYHYDGREWVGLIAAKDAGSKRLCPPSGHE